MNLQVLLNIDIDTPAGAEPGDLLGVNVACEYGAAVSRAIPLERKMFDPGFTEDEVKVAMLLIDGDTRWNITRKLNITSAETAERIISIRRKLGGAEELDPVVVAVAKKYKLSHRQTEMLSYIKSDKTNHEIAAELCLSEETVKGHMSVLKKKLSIDSKQGIAEWLKEFEES